MQIGNNYCDFQVSQGSVETRLRWDGKSYKIFLGI